MSLEMSELERKQNERELRKIVGKAKHIEINERTLEAYRKAFVDKGLDLFHMHQNNLFYIITF
ncbi:MAG: hypothetical protein ACRD97_10585 [Nitrososphaeraceae archaeon]|jgi:hypothetical protein